MEGFLKNLFRKGQDVASGAAGKVVDFFTQEEDEKNRPATKAEKVGQAVGNYFKPAAKERPDGSGIADPQLRVRDVVRSTPEAFASVVGRPILRSFAALGQKLGTADIRSEYMAETPFEKSMFGDSPVSFTSIGKETRLANPEDKTIPFLDPVLGGIIAASDAPTGGRASQTVKGGIKTVKGGIKAFEGATNYTTKVIDALKGKTQVSRQFIEDLLKKPDIKQAEKDLVESVLRETPEGKVDVPRFAEAVEEKVLPLTKVRQSADNTGYENVNLPQEEAGNPAYYIENLYQSPVKTGAGDVHFPGDAPNYFGHTRIEDMPSKDMDIFISKAEGAKGLAILVRNPEDPSTSRIIADGFKSEADAQKYIDSLPEAGTRRVLELQSDLFQKGRLERELNDGKPITNEIRRKYLTSAEEKEWTDARRIFLDYRNNDLDSAVFNKASQTIEDLETKAKTAYIADRSKEVSQLEPYKNTWWERMVREEYAQAARDGKKVLQFPTGETAMKVEGLGGNSAMWFDAGRQAEVNRAVDAGETPSITSSLDPEDLEIGKTVLQGTRTNNTEWVVVDDSMAATGQFTAIPSGRLVQYDLTPEDLADRDFVEELKKSTDLFNYAEDFSIGEGLDRENPIFKFYESQVAKYLQKRFGGKLVTDAQGNTWIQVDVDPRAAGAPVEAFAGFATGMETDEEGNVTGFSIENAMLGAGLALVAKKVGPKALKAQTDELKKAVETARAALASQLKLVKPEARQDMAIFRSTKGDLRVVDMDTWDGTKNTVGALVKGETKPKGELIAVVRQDGTVVDPFDMPTEPRFKSVGDIMDKKKSGGGGKKPPAKPVTMGDVLRPKKGERRFITRTRALDPNLDKFLSGELTPRSTEELAAYADAVIDKDLDAAKKIAEGVDDKAVAVASRLIDKLVNDASEATSEVAKSELWEAAAKVANQAAENLTEHGRAIQAASLLGRMTPAGMVRFAARTIQNHNDAVTKATGPMDKTLGGMFGTKTGKALKEVPELTAAQAESITKQMDEIMALPDGKEKAMKMRKLTDEIQAMVPSSLYEKIITVWKAGLLTGLKTTGLNVMSNTAHNVAEVIKDVPASFVDRVASLFTGKRTLAMTTKGSGKGMVEGVGKGWDYFKTGFDERDIGSKLDYRKVNFGKNKFAKAIQAYEETIFKFIGAQDQPFYYAVKARSLASQAIAQAKNAKLKGKEAKQFVENLMQNPTDDMLKYAVLDAETSVFQNKTTLGKFAREFQKLPGGQVILPFGKTPSAVATQMINYSPVGLAKTIITNIGKGKFDQRLFSQGIGRGLTGTGVMAIGMALFNKGLMTLGYPTSEKEREQWELEGKTPNSIYWGGQWRNVGTFGPAGLVAIVGGHMQNGINETGSVIGGLAQSAAGFGNALTEQSFLKGINSAIDAVKDPERSFSGFASSLAGSIVPTIVSDIARANDEYERLAQTPGTRIQSRIPGARQNLEPKVDTLGNKIETQGFWTVMLDPTRPGNASAKPEDKPVVDELRRLHDAGFPATPTQLGPNKGYETLTPEENTYLWRIAGLAAKDAIKNTMQSRTYGRLDDEEKSKFISDRVDEVKVEARARVILKATAGLEGKELTNKLAQMKEEGLLTKQVFGMYQSLKRREN